MQSLPNDTVDHCPGKNEVSKEIPLYIANLLDPITHVEHLVAATEEISLVTIMLPWVNTRVSVLLGF